jgi:hypothetical protein
METQENLWMRICNLFHADGQTPDGSILRLIQPKPSSSAVPIVSTHSALLSRISQKDKLKVKSDSTNQLSLDRASIAIQLKVSFKPHIAASLTPTSK